MSPNPGESGADSATVFVRDITEWKHSDREFRAEIDALRSQIASLSSENENLTDRLAYQQLREEELSRFREIMNHAGEAIFITDPQTGRFVDVNETACRWLTCSRERLLRLGVGDLDLEFPLETGDGVVNHVADTRGANRPKALVLGSHRRRNGTSFPVEVTISPRRFGDRDLLLVVARDVKQRSRTERSFHVGENERRGLAEISRDAIYCSARDGTVCEVNDSALELFGYTREEFLGLEGRALYRNPEHIAAFKQAVEELGTVKNVRAEFQTKSGRSFRGFLGATLRYDADGNVQGYQCMISPFDEFTGDPPASDIWLVNPGVLEKETEQAKRELGEARSEAAKARATVETTLSQAAKAKSDAEEAKQRADALEREAEQAKREIEEAKSEAAKARADVEKSITQAAIAKLDAKGAQERADALQQEAEQAKRKIAEAKSDAAEARADVEQVKRALMDAKSVTTETETRAEEATTRATRAEAEAKAARLEIEKAKLEIDKARLDAEQARAEAAKAKLEADGAQERVTALEREAERSTKQMEAAKADVAKAMADAEEARSETAKARSDMEEANQRVQQLERETESTIMGPPDAVYVAANEWTLLERAEGEIPLVSTAAASSESAEAPLVGKPKILHRRSRKPEQWPQRSIWPAVWLAFFSLVAVATAIGLVVLWPR